MRADGATRADLTLFARGLAQSRAHAQALIAGGRVSVRAAGSVGERPVRKPSEIIAPDAELSVRPGAAEDFVSRGGVKLAAAFDRVGARLEGARVFDVGISTGGFAHCCLARGAAFVFGIDVGHGQLHPSLIGHPRLRALDGVNGRELAPDLMRREAGDAPFDLVVADVSFISLTLVLPPAIQYLRSGGHAMALVKPQFEVGRSGIGKGGVVKDPAEHKKAERKILELAREIGLVTEDYFESSIEGTGGNKEFFLWAAKP